MNLLGLGKQKIKNKLKNPFAKKRIYHIAVSMSNFNLSGNWEAEGKIYFKNGSTKGEQAFKGKTVDDVLEQINSFLDDSFTAEG